MIIVWDSVNKATGWQAYDAVTQYLAFHAGEGGAAPVVVTTPVVIGGVRKSRFLRRAHRLPWEQDEEDAPAQVVVTEKQRRKRIRLPKEVIETVADAIPVVEAVTLTTHKIVIPDVPVATPDEDDDMMLLML